MPRTIPGDWHPGFIPDNVVLSDEAYLDSSQCFDLYRSEAPEGLRISAGDGIYLPTQFDVGPRGRVSLGKYVMLNGPRIICDELIEIGDYTVISWNVILMDTYRLPFDPQQRRQLLQRVGELPFSRRKLDAAQPPRPISVGPNVWLGFDSIILPGVRIGEGAIVGARSVVIDDIPANTIAVGNPARAVKTL